MGVEKSGDRRPACENRGTELRFDVKRKGRISVEGVRQDFAAVAGRRRYMLKSLEKSVQKAAVILQQQIGAR